MPSRIPTLHHDASNKKVSLLQKIIWQCMSKKFIQSSRLHTMLLCVQVDETTVDREICVENRLRKNYLR